MQWACIPINPTHLKLEFIGSKPPPEEVAALEVALRRLFLTQRSGAVGFNAWRLAARFPEATLEDLRRQTLAKWDVL